MTTPPSHSSFKTLQSTRSINDVCEIQRQLMQQQAPLRFRMTVSPESLTAGGQRPIDSSASVYGNLPVVERFSKLTRDKSRTTLQTPGLGIPTTPSQTTGPLLSASEIQVSSMARPLPSGIDARCGRFVVDPRTFEVLAPRAMFDAHHLPHYPSSTRSEQRSHWNQCQDKFVSDLKKAGSVN